MAIARILGTAALLASFVLAPVSALAATTGLTIQPVKASYTLAPGASVSGAISLTNASTEAAVQVDLKVEDFIPLAGSDQLQFVPRAEGVTTVRDWVTLNGGEHVITLQKGENRTIPFTITAPLDAEPGSHFGAAFFKATDLADVDKQLKVGTQVGMLIFVTVPGNYEQKGRILSFSAPRFIQATPFDFKIAFENTGTVHFEPKGAVSVKNIFGSVVAEVPVEGQVVLPTGTKDLTARFDTEGFLLGRYVAKVNLLDGEGNALTSEERAFYVFPVWYVLGFIGCAAIIFFLIRFLKSRVSISFK